MGLIIRNDDVSPSSNFDNIAKMYDVIRTKLPQAEIWSCVTLMSKGQADSVYPDLPLKTKSLDYLYDVDKLWTERDNLGTIVSHGLLHVKHGELPKEAQRMSILTSCNFLRTNIFVPPFTNYNFTTMQICWENGIKLSTEADGWKSLETTPFNPNHTKWFFHSWRFTPEKFEALFK